MHIPVKVDYGVRALVDLAQHTGEEPIRAADIARRTAIPEQFLEQVLLSLSKIGVVKSQRGPQGGHTLAKAPSEIRLSAIMYSLGGAETPVKCLDDLNICIHVPACAQRELWRSVADAVFNILDSTTIADLVERTQTLNRERADKAALEPITVAF